MWSWRRWAAWTAVTAAAETIGYAGAAVLFNRPYGPVLAGLFEGSCLGLLQGLLLRRLLGRFPVGAWWLVTAAAATAGWAGAGAATSGADSGGPGAGLGLTAVMAAVLGAVMGAVLGTLQWLVLRGRVSHAGRWIPVSTMAWAVGMVPAMLVATAPSAPVPTAALLLLGGVGGLLMGTAVGMITGPLVAGWTPLHTPGDRTPELA